MNSPTHPTEIITPVPPKGVLFLPPKGRQVGINVPLRGWYPLAGTMSQVKMVSFMEDPLVIQHREELWMRSASTRHKRSLLLLFVLQFSLFL
jgi:hypothetical protein